MNSKEAAPDESMRLRRVLAPVDFSQHSLDALRQARAIAAKLGAMLIVLHVVEPFHADLYMDTSGLQRKLRREAGEQLDALMAREFPTRKGARAVLRAGSPAAVITQFARDSDTDLIVLSTLGRTGIKRALIGSVAERVVRHSPCPVLVLPCKRP